MKPDLTAEHFDTALMRLRQSAATASTGNGLWADLRAVLGLDEEEAQAALLEWHGIVVINDEQWHRVGKEVVNLSDDQAQPCLRVVLDGRNLLLAEDPWSPLVATLLSRHGDARLGLARPGQISQLQERRAGSQTPVSTREPVAPASPGKDPSSPVVALVDSAIQRAYAEGASDIHFETNRAGIGIKYRLDGVMVAGERLDDPQRAEEVISRIKVMAQLDITERRRPQDGRIHWQRAGHDTIDLRVSIMPSIFGEDAVLRLLDKAQLRHAQQSMSLDVLGFDARSATSIRALAARPHGMLLITGPTGSGKTTTVYAALSEVNDGLEKIVTIEDPVEYELPGVLQIPVNEQKGLTFATGLRSILRHDPDKILVGEIRDSETAEIAVQSSLTGHLVMTTVHANSLFDVLGRFRHFGIESFALASALNGIVVQRLLRRLCPHCLAWRSVTAAEKGQLELLQLAVPESVPVAHGCEACRHTGYRGRFVVAEVHGLSDAVRDLIVRNTAMAELRTILYKNPDERLLSVAVSKVAQGVTTLEEVSRVVGLA